MVKKIERINYLDSAKGIAILLVILGHICDENPIKIWLYSFHLPLFFFVSGSVLSLKRSDININDSFKSRLKSLILPYFGFSFIILCIKLIENQLIEKASVTDLILKKSLTIITFKGVDALWFLPCLFVAEITFLCFIKYLKSKVIIIAILILFSILPFINFSIFNNQLYYIEIMRILIGIVFLGVGYYTFNIIKNKDYNIIIPIIILITNIVLSRYNGAVDLYSLVLKNYFMYFSSALCGIISIVLICKRVKSSNAIRFLGVNSLIIMASHVELIIVVSKLVSIVTRKLGSYFNNNIFTDLSVLIIVVLIEVPIIYAINKYFYFLVGKKHVDKMKMENIVKL